MHLRDEIDRTLTEQELEFLDSVGHLPQDELTAQYDDASEKFKGKTNHDLIYSLKNTYKIPSNQKLEQAFKASAVIYEYRQRGLDKAAQAGQHHPGKDHKSKQWLHEVRADAPWLAEGLCVAALIAPLSTLCCLCRLHRM
jgi:hypothetical protein